MTSGWFATRRLEPGVHLVSEPVHVNSFLVEGSATAALIDTGLGIGNIREAAESLVSRDVFAINTHYHFDHTGGNHWFARRLIHALGAEATMRPRDSAHYRAYCLYIRPRTSTRTNGITEQRHRLRSSTRETGLTSATASSRFCTRPVTPRTPSAFWMRKVGCCSAVIPSTLARYMLSSLTQT